MLQKFDQWKPRSENPLPDGLVVERAEDLRRTSSNNTPVRSADDRGLAFWFGEGGMSRASFRTRPGVVWTASCQVTLVRPGELLPCKFGPVFLDSDGKIVRWWHTVKVLFDDANTCNLNVRTTSPPEAAWVKLGVLGPWADNGQSTAIYKFTDCLLAKADSGTPQ